MKPLPVIWKREVMLVAWASMFLWLIGITIGLSYWLALSGLAAYLSWHLYYLRKLVRWVDGQGKQLPVSATGVWGYIFYRLEVRDRKSATRKKQIGKLLREFNTSAKALPDATIVLDHELVIQWINKAAVKLIGVQKSDAGQPITNLIRHPDFNAFINLGDYKKTLELLSPVDAQQHLVFRLVPYGHNQFLLIARDRTEQYRLEKMRHDFIANASHELRTPLSVLQGSVEQLETDDLSEAMRSPIERMRRQVDRMRSILHDLLTLARIESGDEALKTENLHLNQLVEEVLEEARTYSRRRGEHALLFTSDDDYRLLVNRNEFHTVISNLVMNAINYTDAGGEIEVQLFRESGGLRVKVRDTGIGIAAEHLERLTERFYRVDSGRSREAGGTGLGLSIVKHVLDQYGTSLEIDSQVGGGSEFSFLISSHFIENQSKRKRAVND